MRTHPRKRVATDAAALERAALAERDQPRCGVCDKPSARPLCGRCDHVLTLEQYGDPKKLATENRKGCGGCGRRGDCHNPGCPVVARG